MLKGILQYNIDYNIQGMTGHDIKYLLNLVKDNIPEFNYDNFYRLDYLSNTIIN